MYPENLTNPYDGRQSQLGQHLTLNQYMARTFLWMFAGLLITFAVALVDCRTLFMVRLFLFDMRFLYVLVIAELAVVIVLSARLEKLSPRWATALFVLYAVLNGATFSVFFLVYEVESLILIFLLTAAYYAVMAFFGWKTQKDLSSWKIALGIGLGVLALFWLVSLIINLSQFETIVCLAGTAVFLCVTAYDTQKIKARYYATLQDGQMAEKACIFSALQLYLDFINLFLYLLRLLGKKR